MEQIEGNHIEVIFGKNQRSSLSNLFNLHDCEPLLMLLLFIANFRK